MKAVVARAMEARMAALGVPQVVEADVKASDRIELTSRFSQAALEIERKSSKNLMRP